MMRFEINAQTGEVQEIQLTPEEEAEALARAAAEAKERKPQEIERQRDMALDAGFTHDATLWHCDQTFQSQITSYVLAFAAGILPPQATVPVRDKGNITHQLTQQHLGELAAALMVHVQGIYAASWAAKDAL